MNKNYVLDTNVLLSDDDCLDKLCTGGNLVHIPIVCLEELDRHKSRPDEVGKNARAIARKIDGYRKEGSLAEGITLPSGGTLRVVSCDFETYVPEGLDPTKVDNKIIGCAFYLKREIAQWDRESNPKIRDRVLCLVATGMNKDAALLEAVQQTEESADVTLISQDINVRLKCDSVGIPAEDYKASHVTVKNDSLYSGVTRISVDDPAIIDQLYFNVKKSQSACHSLFQNPEYDLRPNEICVVKYEDAVTHASQSAMVRVLDPELGTYKIIIERKNQNVVFGLSQKNKEQGFALDLLLDPNVSLVTLAGTAGTGKTLIAIAAGLQQVLESNIYTKMIITRPIEPVGRDVGFLPGTAAQKMSPWVAPIRDNLEFLCAPNSKGLASEKKEKGDKDKKGSANKPLQQPDSEDFSRNAFVNTMVLKGQIEVEAVTFIRGRSFPKCFIIVDEAQNLTLHQLKTIITRSGEGSKIVLTGDLSQIDVSSMDALSSGFTHAIEKFKDYPIAGHITLLKGERSELATLAADLL